jgi:hypothetical protein
MRRPSPALLALAPLALAASASAWASDPDLVDVEPLTSGEFRNTAHTIEKGKFVLHPLLLPSGYGITDKLDVKTSIWGLLGGPNASVEYVLVDGSDGDGVALSIEPNVNADWSFASYGGGVTLNSTVPMGEANRFNLRAGGSYANVAVFTVDGQGNLVASNRSIRTVGVPLSLGYDLVTSDRTTWRFTGDLDVLTFANTPVGLVSATWNHAIPRRFRIALGVGAYIGPNPVSDIAQELGIGFLSSKALVLPLPLIELWWAL